ncbi:hypothetical protein [Glycomyces buryatensis]|uniref:DUF4853 domain-containing protein n=1 Tax=Glycomyces buryatensis TaxID=2570927 RepID=A0A4S8QDH0_9ACTN|nr:hypothetical protein [Glycomyces buryatensis]THV42418.1 hypothetical protein FAB82_07125 [Glycomyces buryatensis]
MDTPPKSEYTQAEAYGPMEATAADAVAALPDFPGFEQRSWDELPCTHNGQDDPDYTNIEIRYRLSAEDSESALVREQYVDVLRDHWTSLGYEITADSVTEKSERTDRLLGVELEHGISISYAVGRYGGLFVQSGCVPVSDLSEFEYIPPAGGIEPGSEGDKVEEYFPDGIPSADATAIDPFANTQSVAALAPFDSPGSYEGQL